MSPGAPGPAEAPRPAGSPGPAGSADTARTAGLPRDPPASPGVRAAWALGAVAILAQVAYPLVSGGVRDAVTVATVVVFCAASVTHAAATRGPRWAAAYLAVAAGGGFAVEAVGIATGFPFGGYDYTGSLGPELLGVPLVIPAAWAMMAYPSLLVGRRLTRSLAPVARRLAAPVVSGWALASWDLFLDPQMVGAGHWRWLDVTTSVPGLPGIPVSNFVGWFVFAAVIGAVLDALLPDRPPASGGAGADPVRDDRMPAVLHLWTYASQVLGHLVFFGSPSVALVGGIGMGAVAAPYALVLRREGRGRWARTAPGPGSR